MENARSISGINERVEEIKRLFSESECPVQAGSVLRVPSYAYKDWGIEITQDNRGWLFSESERAYASEWQKTDEKLNRMVAEAGERAGIGDVNRCLNRKVGAAASAIARRAIESTGRFVLLDIGAGAGQTTLEFLKSMAEKRICPTALSEIMLIEPSESRLVQALDAVRGLVDEIGRRASPKLRQLVGISGFAGTDVEVIPKLGTHRVDVAVANAALHHHAFDSYAAQIERVLAREGALVCGDWHNTLWERPSHTYWLLYSFERMGDAAGLGAAHAFLERGEKPRRLGESAGLAAFRKHFGLREADALCAFGDCSLEERRANLAIVKFWCEVGKSGPCSLRFLEGHTRVGRRIESLGRAGLHCRGGRRGVEFINPGKLGENAGVMVACKGGIRC